MSYTFLLDAVEESSAECFSDIPASVLSKLNLTVEKSCCNGSETESCPGFRFGIMPTPSMVALGAESQAWSAVETPAKEIATLPAMVFPLRAWERSFSASLGKSNPSASLEKILTRQEETLLGLLENSETPWKPLGMQPLWSSWGHVVWEVITERCDHGSLAFRSPNARDWKGMSAKSWRERTVGDTTPTLPDQIGGVPHPEFAEELMLWPVGWTDLKPLETAKFQQWLDSHGKHSQLESPAPSERNLKPH